MAGDKEYDAELADLATRIEKLRIHYQGYFLGLEKVPPLFERDQLERAIRLSSLHEARRAVYKFRFQSLCQRFRTLAVYWDRVMRDLEEGKVTRESMRREAGYAPMAPAPGVGAGEEGSGPGSAAEVPGPDAGSGTSGETPSSPDPVVGLWRDYLSARSALGLPIEGITESAFRAGLEKARQVQRERLGVPDVRFSVVVKDGKVVLLARPEGAAPEAREA